MKDERGAMIGGMGLSPKLLGALALVGLTAAVAQPQPQPRQKPVEHKASLSPAEFDVLASRNLLIPVKDIRASQIRDTFDEGRGKRKHEALDILAPRGTPVIAVDDGKVAKLFTSVAGGITLYQFDPSQQYVYYYAHLEGYAPGVKEGMQLKRGDVVGYVGTTGNAPKGTPHLHFAIFRMTPEKKWWKGTALNPFPYLTRPSPGQAG